MEQRPVILVELLIEKQPKMRLMLLDAHNINIKVEHQGPTFSRKYQVKSNANAVGQDPDDVQRDIKQQPHNNSKPNAQEIER